MSTLFRIPPSSFVKHDNFEPIDADNAAGVGGVLREPELNQDYKSSADRKTSSVLLRDDHIVLLAIDALLILHALIKKWRSRRRTLREVANFDERQLRDIGLTRDEVLSKTPFELRGPHQSYRALAELDDAQLSNLSERGLQVRREARRTAHHHPR